jgi:hypothetical protein
MEAQAAVVVLAVAVVGVRLAGLGAAKKETIEAAKRSITMTQI